MFWWEVHPEIEDECDRLDMTGWLPTVGSSCSPPV
jgi:hypothetical protein